MKAERYLPHLVTLVLLTLSGVYHSPAYAFASVVSVLGILAHSVVEARVAALTPKPGLLDEATRRTLQDLNARLVTLEHGVRTRGF